MFLNQDQIQELLGIIDFTTSIFIGNTLGNDVLSEYDKHILLLNGVNVDEVGGDWPPAKQAYYFGKLSTLLQRKDAQSISYQDFKHHLYNKQYLPLTVREVNSFKILQEKSYHHLKGLGERMKKDVTDIIDNKRQMTRDEYEKVIGDEIARGVIDHKNASEVAREIGKKTGDWERDLGRIAETEMQDIFEHARADEFRQRYGDETLVYKDVYEGACRHCIRLFKEKGLDSKPKTFKLSELQQNGSNIGRTVSEWKATIGPIHPWCRCNIRVIQPGQEWDPNKKDFVFVRDENKRPLGVRITVGEKVYNI